MNNQDKQRTDEFVKRAHTRIELMKQAAQELTQALDLPHEAAYDVLATIARQAPPEALIEEQTEHDELDTVSPQLRSQPLPGKAHREGKQDTNGGFPKRYGKGLNWVRTLAAVILVALFVGSLVLVLNMARQNKIGSQPLGPDRAGLYVVTSEGVYRLDEHNGKLTQRWYYKLSAPRSEDAINAEKSPFPLAFSLVDTPVTVVDGVAYFGGLEEDKAHNPHHYLYALNTEDGSLLWRHQIDGGSSGIKSPYIFQTSNTFAVVLDPGKAFTAPLVWHDIVYINVFSSSEEMYIVALAKSDGAVRWAYKYPPPANSVDTIGGMGAIENDLIYITNGNTLFTLRTDSGHEQWSTQVPQEAQAGQYQFSQVPQVVNGVVYVANTVEDNGADASRMYAFNATDGTQLWRSALVNSLISTPTINNDIVYFTSQDAFHDSYLYALHAQDGTSFWKYHSGDSIFAAPQVMDGKVYVRETPSSESFSGPERVQVTAIDASTGTRLSTYPLPVGNSRWIIGYGRLWPLIAHNGVIYVTVGGTLYSLRASDCVVIQGYALNTSFFPDLTLAS